MLELEFEPGNTYLQSFYFYPSQNADLTPRMKRSRVGRLSVAEMQPYPATLGRQGMLVRGGLFWGAKSKRAPERRKQTNHSSHKNQRAEKFKHFNYITF